ncbi:MAG: SRPBCC family protein [Acidimicrobiia bacterium]
MKITQEFVVAQGPETVWDFFADVRAVAECMPGTELSEVRPEGSYAGKVSVKLGPMTAAFEGEATVERDDSTRTGQIRGAGVDRRGGSRAQVEVAYRLEEVSEGTKVIVDADLTLAGAAAQFGRTGLVREMSTRLARQFVECLEATLSAPGEDGGRPAGEVRGLSLFFSSLWASLAGAIRRLVKPEKGN